MIYILLLMIEWFVHHFFLEPLLFTVDLFERNSQSIMVMRRHLSVDRKTTFDGNWHWELSTARLFEFLVEHCWSKKWASP